MQSLSVNQGKLTGQKKKKTKPTHLILDYIWDYVKFLASYYLVVVKLLREES